MVVKIDIRILLRIDPNRGKEFMWIVANPKALMMMKFYEFIQTHNYYTRVSLQKETSIYNVYLLICIYTQN